MYNSDNSVVTIDQFGYCGMITCGAAPFAIPQMKTRKKDMETTMNTTIDNNIVARQALDRALNKLEDQVLNKAYDTYGFEEERRPKTAQDIIEWIKNDEFTAPDTEDENYDPENYRYHDLKGIRFKPLKKKDREGYDKHVETFTKDRNALRLDIQVLEPERALANFRKLEKEYTH